LIDKYNITTQGLADSVIENKGDSPMDLLLHDLMLDICDQLRANLVKYNANTKSLGLSQSIQPTKVEHVGSEVNIGIEAEDYWKFINYGVNGEEVNHGAPNWGRQRSSGVSFHQAILNWIPKRGLIKPDKFDTYDQYAWAIQSNIKKYGKAPKPFYSDVINKKIVSYLKKPIEELLGQAIKINIVASWQ
jgi:hypothetical protein